MNQEQTPLTCGYVQGYTDCLNKMESCVSNAVKSIREPMLKDYVQAINSVILHLYKELAYTDELRAKLTEQMDESDDIFEDVSIIDEIIKSADKVIYIGEGNLITIIKGGK